MDWFERLRGARKPRVFLSYRRQGDSSGYAARLGDRLNEYFGEDQVFRDVDDIAPGDDFEAAIRRAFTSCHVLIVVIGPDWTKQTDSSGGFRLNDPEDWVRIELTAALEHDLRVFPVLVAGATFPRQKDLPKVLRGLCRLQAQELCDKRWDFDVRRLLESVAAAGIEPALAKTDRKRVSPLAIGGLLACGVGAYVLRGAPPIDTVKPSAEPQLTAVEQRLPSDPGQSVSSASTAAGLTEQGGAAGAIGGSPVAKGELVALAGAAVSATKATSIRRKRTPSVLPSSCAADQIPSEQGCAARCPQSRRWNGTACVDPCTPEQHWTAQGCRACASNETWDGERCQNPRDLELAGLRRACTQPAWRWCEEDETCEPKNYNHSAPQRHMDLRTPPPSAPSTR